MKLCDDDAGAYLNGFGAAKDVVGTYDGVGACNEAGVHNPDGCVDLLMCDGCVDDTYG